MLGIVAEKVARHLAGVNSEHVCHAVVKKSDYTVVAGLPPQNNS